MSSALKIARSYKDINSIGLHFEQTHISVVVKAGCNLKTLMPARNDRKNLSLKMNLELLIDYEQYLFIKNKTCLVAKVWIQKDTVELQWLEHLWDHGKLFEPWVVRANEG